jgi:hypothetical protein
MAAHGMNSRRRYEQTRTSPPPSPYHLDNQQKDASRDENLANQQELATPARSSQYKQQANDGAAAADRCDGIPHPTIITPRKDSDMKVTPIIMSAPMIRALLEGRKQQTRRILKPQSMFDGSEAIVKRFPRQKGCPYGESGQSFLWVRETFCPVDDEEFGGSRWIDYRATPRYSQDAPAGWENASDDPNALKWKPSIFMPRRVSRLTLELSGVHVERLQAISEEDALAEGIVHDRAASYSRFHVPGVEHPAKDFPELSRTNAREMYAALWDCLHGSGAWLANPWVWVLTFRVHQVNIDTFLKTREVAA